MRCEYCGVEVTEYPASGICDRCGGSLPQRPAEHLCPACGAPSRGNFCSRCGRSLHGEPVFSGQVPPVYAPVEVCPRCRSTRLVKKRRGFSWVLGILGFFLIPVFGLLLGFCGRRKITCKCLSCGRKLR